MWSPRWSLGIGLVLPIYCQSCRLGEYCQGIPADCVWIIWIIYNMYIYIYIWQSTIRNDITLKKSRPCYLFALNTMARCCCFFDLVFQPPRRISTMGLGCRSSKLPSCFAQQIYQWDQAGPGLSNRAGLLAGFPNDNKHVCFLGQFGIFIYKIPYDKVNPLGIWLIFNNIYRLIGQFWIDDNSWDLRYVIGCTIFRQNHGYLSVIPSQSCIWRTLGTWKNCVTHAGILVAVTMCVSSTAPNYSVMCEMSTIMFRVL